MDVPAKTCMLARYTAWADARLFAAIAKLPEGAELAKRRTLFGNMLRTLTPAFAELRSAQAALGEWFVTYVGQCPRERGRRLPAALLPHRAWTTPRPFPTGEPL